MEAASARYAARDRFSYPNEPASTPLQRYIQNACSPENFEPNLALSLEIADLINAKKGGAPREAAMAIVAYVNHRNANVSLLALSLLDICVKNCGYPFHLQISTKDFLNELVRRFPERPPPRTTRVQTRILELVEEWRRTICETSRYKEDLGFIRDMHRLLHYKGYVFPEVRREDAAVLNPSDNLKSAEEMEAEERSAQSAKLQELIRRGTPHDLQEANRLMKVMAGFDTRHKTDYRAKAAEEVSKIQQKAKLLEEMLQGQRNGDTIEEGDVFEELANALASAHPKIQRMCEVESDDHEAVAKLFEINDSIHRTVERYKLMKKGDVEGANAIPKGTLGVSGAGVFKGPNNELSLIDFDVSEAPRPSDQTAHTGALGQSGIPGSSLQDDLLGLSLGGADSAQEGGIYLGPPKNKGTAHILAQFSQPTQVASNSIFNTQPTPKTQASASQDLFGSLPPAVPSVQQPANTPKSLHQTRPSDPFASLNASSRQSSPFQFQQFASKPPATPTLVSSNLDLLGGSSAPPPASHDDEWEFSSSLPDQSTEITVTNSSIKTVFAISRSDSAEMLIASRISNSTSNPIADLTFQVAVTKGYTLRLEPQSSRTLSPNQKNGITQNIHLQGVEQGKGTSVKIRWRASYTVAGLAHNEQGEINGLGIA